MKTVRRLISVILTFVMIFTATPAVFSVDAPAYSGIALTEPTPERILCALHYATDMGWLYNKEILVNIYDDNGEPMLYGDLADEDGVLDPSVVRFMYEMIGDYTEEDLEQVMDVYDLLYIVAEGIYDIMYSFSDDFARHYSSALKFYNKFIIGNVFGGDERPPVADAMAFLFDGMIFEDEDGYALYAYSMELIDSEGVPLFLTDVMEVNGVYLRPDDYGYRNVFLHLADARENGELDPYQAFEILTGYAPDASGRLVTSTYIENYILDIDGNKVKYADELINEDLTVGNTGLSAREFAVNTLMELYALDAEMILGGILPENAAAELAGYFPRVTEADIEAELDLWIEMLREEGFIYDEYDEAYCLVEYVVMYDYRGYLIDSSYMGYAVNADGGIVMIDDVMDADGNFVTDEFGAETVWELLDEYIAGMETDISRKGDVNDDGKVNLADVSAVLKNIAKWDVEIDGYAADVDGDGRVDLYDATLMLQYIADWDVWFEY